MLAKCRTKANIRLLQTRQTTFRFYKTHEISLSADGIIFPNEELWCIAWSWLFSDAYYKERMERSRMDSTGLENGPNTDFLKSVDERSDYVNIRLLQQLLEGHNVPQCL